jgi:single-stranded-DNA-specific exonuclease
MDVVVIDHHHIPPKLPPALVSINAKMPESGYPFRELCGAGTAFKVVQGVYQKLAPEKEDQLKWLLDLVAVGTVADCMPIVDENRVLVKYGLIVLSKTRRLGLRELYTVGRIRIGEDQLPNSETIGFSIAPRINAAGRMAHAIIAHELLVTKDRDRAHELADILEKHNKDRQKITASITDEVRALVKERFSEKCCVLSAEPHYPLGIVGLVAGRIADEFKKPTAILTRGERESHGSFRSIPGVSVISAIENCRDLLVRYGGHEQAAGMIIKNENIEAFYERFGASVAEMMQAIDDRRQTTNDTGMVVTDDESKVYPASVDFFTLDFVALLKQFEPFGIGNVEPVFIIHGAIIREVRYVGSGEKHLKMILEISDKAEKRFVDAIGFHLGGGEVVWTNGAVVDVVGNIQENVWNGRKSVQVMIRDMRQVTGDK